MPPRRARRLRRIWNVSKAALKAVVLTFSASLKFWSFPDIVRVVVYNGQKRGGYGS